jgi:hypothetical protein
MASNRTTTSRILTYYQDGNSGVNPDCVVFSHTEMFSSFHTAMEPMPATMTSAILATF